MAKPNLNDDPYVSGQTRWWQWHSYIKPKLLEIITWFDGLRQEFQLTATAFQTKRSDEVDWIDVFPKSEIIGPPGPQGDPGVDGNNGLSAYDVWISLGNVGTEADFIASLTGPAGADGVDGTNGTDGLSAYQVWLNLGNSGTEQDFINSLTPQSGDMSAGYFFDNTGGQTIGASAVVINLDTAPVNVGGILSILNDEITVSQAGQYLIDFRVGGALASGTRTGFLAYLEKDSGSGFSEIPGTRTSAYQRVVGEIMGDASGAVIVTLAAGDKVRLMAIQTTASVSTVAGYSGMGLILLTGAVGPSGPAGANGTDGVNSINMSDGAGAPSAGLGVDGDWYLNDTTGDLYHKESGSWILKANLMGPSGSGLPTGGTAGQMIRKNSSTDQDASWTDFEWQGTQAAWDALGTYDNNVTYYIPL